MRRNTLYRSDQNEEHSTEIRSEGRTLDTDQIRRKNTRHRSDQKEEHSTQIRSEGRTLNTDQIRRKNTRYRSDQTRKHTRRDQMIKNEFTRRIQEAASAKVCPVLVTCCGCNP
jgi:hypothetical protein